MQHGCPYNPNQFFDLLFVPGTILRHMINKKKFILKMTNGMFFRNFSAIYFDFLKIKVKIKD